MFLASKNIDIFNLDLNLFFFNYNELMAGEDLDYSQIPPEDLDMLHFNPFAERGRMSNEPIDPSNEAFREIVESIHGSGGKIPFSRFMEISLFGKDGYYSKGRAKIGTSTDEAYSDFTTSSETSPLFGGTIGRQMIKVWKTMGEPEKFQIVELGGGTGALASSLIGRVKQLDPGFYNALSYTIVEYGGLITQQQETIGKAREQSRVTWIQGSATEIPVMGIKGAIISNELVDAFPIERVAMINGKIKQKFVTVDERGRFFELWQEPSTEVLAYLKDFDIKLKEKVEEPVNLSAIKFQKQAQKALFHGVILTIDYGRNGEVGDEQEDVPLIRYKGTPFNPELGFVEVIDPIDDVDDTPPYRFPGEIDITADVNFKPLEQVALKDGLEVVFAGLQKDFLEKSGFAEELERVSQAIQEAQSVEEAFLLDESYEDAKDLVTGFGEFYTLFLSKGISYEF